MDTQRPHDGGEEATSLYEGMHAKLTKSLGYILNSDDGEDHEDNDGPQRLSVSMVARRKKIEHILSEMESFHASGSVEALRVCELDFDLGVDYLGDLLNVISALQRLGGDSLRNGVTKEHVNIHTALKRERINVRYNTRPGWFDVEVFRENTRATLALAYRDPAQVPLILELISQRHLLEVEQLEGALREMNRLAAPLVQGAL
jgi:hypothetical protein